MAEEKKPATAAEGKDVVEAKTGTALVENDFFEGSGEGMEDFSNQDFTVPFLGILQALSKPLQKGHSKYIKGAEQGQFYNSATAEVYPGEASEEGAGIFLVPVHFEHRYVAWKPNNGGIAHDYGSDPIIYDGITPIAEGKDAGKRLDPEGNEVVDAMQYFTLRIDPAAMTIEPAVVSFAKIHAKKAKKWNNLIRAHVEMREGKPFKPAIWFYYYKATTVPESNDKGSWYGWNIEDAGKLMDLGEFGKTVFQAAKELRAQILAGEVKAATEEPAGDDTGAGDGDGAF